MTDKFVFISGNQNKVNFLSKWLGSPVAHKKVDLEEIQSLDLHQIVEYKARQAYDLLKEPVLVEDAALTYAAMGRLPGTFIRWFIEELGYDGLVRLADGLPDRTAVGTMCYGYYDGTTMHLFDGQMKGKIARTLRGTGGFGFDTIFINEGFTKTRAEMTEQDYMRTSYRTDALTKLKTFFDTTA